MKSLRLPLSIIPPDPIIMGVVVREIVTLLLETAIYLEAVTETLSEVNIVIPLVIPDAVLQLRLLQLLLQLHPLSKVMALRITPTQSLLQMLQLQLMILMTAQ